MKLRTSLAAAGAAVVFGTTGAFVFPAVASAHSTTHTLRLISVAKKAVGFTKTTGGQQDTDLNSKGKTIGFDMLYFVITSPTAGTLEVTVDTKGGFLYGKFTGNISTGKLTNGKVTGGTGKFKGSTGTIKAKRISSTREAVTITYRT